MLPIVPLIKYHKCYLVRKNKIIRNAKKCNIFFCFTFCVLAVWGNYRTEGNLLIHLSLRATPICCCLSRSLTKYSYRQRNYHQRQKKLHVWAFLKQNLTKNCQQDKFSSSIYIASLLLFLLLDHPIAFVFTIACITHHCEALSNKLKQ